MSLNNVEYKINKNSVIKPYKGDCKDYILDYDRYKDDIKLIEIENKVFAEIDDAKIDFNMVRDNINLKDEFILPSREGYQNEVYINDAIYTKNVKWLENIVGYNELKGFDTKIDGGLVKLCEVYSDLLDKGLDNARENYKFRDFDRFEDILLKYDNPLKKSKKGNSVDAITLLLCETEVVETHLNYGVNCVDLAKEWIEKSDIKLKDIEIPTLDTNRLSKEGREFFIKEVIPEYSKDVCEYEIKRLSKSENNKELISLLKKRVRRIESQEEDISR